MLELKEFFSIFGSEKNQGVKMSKDLKEQALEYHSMGKPGKIEIVPTKPHSTQTDLGLAYTPGVAVPCLEIEKDNNLAYEYTGKGNLVAVISYRRPCGQAGDGRQGPAFQDLRGHRRL